MRRRELGREARPQSTLSANLHGESLPSAQTTHRLARMEDFLPAPLFPHRHQEPPLLYDGQLSHPIKLDPGLLRRPSPSDDS